MPVVGLNGNKAGSLPSCPRSQANSSSLWPLCSAPSAATLRLSSLRLQYEPLGAAIVDDLRRVEIALRVRRHVMDDVEVAGLCASISERANLGHRRPIEDDDAHRSGVDD